MPVVFVSNAESTVYGRYTGPPSRAELEKLSPLDDDIARLSPFGRKHINVIGTSSFTAPNLDPAGARELRNPDTDDE